MVELHQTSDVAPSNLFKHLSKNRNWSTVFNTPKNNMIIWYVMPKVATIANKQMK